MAAYQGADVSDLDRYHAVRARPSQARGKERVRVIMAVALKLFRTKGLDAVSTNDIARAAGIPIGSLYRYFPNKEAIISALTKLYIEDLSRVFGEIENHPLLDKLSWDEILVLIVDSWVAYARLNGPFALLYVEQAHPRLLAQNKGLRDHFIDAFGAVLKKRCPKLTGTQVLVTFKFVITASELGTNTELYGKTASSAYYDAVRCIASYLGNACKTAHDLRG